MAQHIRTAKYKRIEIAEKPFGSGGEGDIFAIVSPLHYNHHCLKLLHPKWRTVEREKKMQYMVNNPPARLDGGTFRICWPQELVYQDGEFAGFIMPAAFLDSIQVYELCQLTVKPYHRDKFRKFERGEKHNQTKRLQLCVNIAIAVHIIHSLGEYVLVDMKPQNLLATPDGRISLIDLDSIQIANSQTLIHPAQAVTVEYTPPESQDLDPAVNYIPITWDRFSLAIIFYEILFGIHPFVATHKGKYQDCTTIADSIQKQLFPFGKQSHHVLVLPPPHHAFHTLFPELQALFLRTFDEGCTTPDKRPSAEEWGRALNQSVYHTVIQKPVQSKPKKSEHHWGLWLSILIITILFWLMPPEMRTVLGWLFKLVIGLSVELFSLFLEWSHPYLTDISHWLLTHANPELVRIYTHCRDWTALQFIPALIDFYHSVIEPTYQVAREETANVVIPWLLEDVLPQLTSYYTVLRLYCTDFYEWLFPLPQ